jgi:hypothetical protein
MMEEGRKPGRVPRHTDRPTLPDDALYDEAWGPRPAFTRPLTPVRIVSGRPEREHMAFENILDTKEPGCIYYRADHLRHCENVPYPDQWSVVVRAKNGTVSSVLHGRNGMSASPERIAQAGPHRAWWLWDERKLA